MFLIRTTAYPQVNAGGASIPVAEIPTGGFVTLKASALNASTYQWYKDEQSISGATLITYKATAPGIYTVLAYSNANCSSVLSDAVKLIDKPIPPIIQANLQIIKKSETKKTGINEPFEYMISVTNKGPNDATDVVVTDLFPEGLMLKEMISASVGLFDFNTSLRKASWKIDKLELGQTAELRFNAASLNPGLLKNTATVTAVQEDPSLADNQSTDEREINGLKVPNVFTPNGDNVNDVFEIRGLELYAQNEISIINRWGNIIYDKKDYKNDWDGFGLDEGTYFYILKVRATTGSWHTYKGYTTLLRAKSQ